MLGDAFRNFLEPLLKEKTGLSLSSLETKTIGGGSINNTYWLLVNNTFRLFLKMNNATRYPGLFEKEKQGIEFLSGPACIATPSVFFCGNWQENQVLLLEWIDPGPRTDHFWKKFGEQLALLHRCSHHQFGFDTDNYMGALPQSNSFTGKWTDFFINHRLLPQIRLARKNDTLTGKYVDLFQHVCNRLDMIFPASIPSLLHGDLWSGNFICNKSAEPVLIDPAVYYGDRNMDLAMTTLFGGFDKAFYDSYHYHFPLTENFREQWDICNLYPLLVHLNLFGESYLGDIISILKRFS